MEARLTDQEAEELLRRIAAVPPYVTPTTVAGRFKEEMNARSLTPVFQVHRETRDVSFAVLGFGLRLVDEEALWDRLNRKYGMKSRHQLPFPGITLTPRWRLLFKAPTLTEIRTAARFILRGGNPWPKP